MKCQFRVVFALYVALAMHAALGSAQALRLDFSPTLRERILARMETKTLVCPRCETPPEIDGRLDDAAWRQAAAIERLSAAPRTRVRICRDDTALYVAFECHEQAGRTPTAKAKSRDDLIRYDDRVEVWIDPDPKDDAAYRFVINRAGVVFDGIQRGAARLADYNPDWSHAVERGQSSWTVETAIPLKALGLTSWPANVRGPRGGALPGRLGFNVGREGPGLEAASWTPPYSDTSRSFLVFSDAAAAKEAAPQTVAPKSAAAGAALRVEFERYVARPGGRWLEARVRVQPKGERLDRARVRASLFPLGKTQSVANVAVAPERCQGRLAVDLRSPGLTRARVCVELLEGDECTSVVEAFVSAQPCEMPLKPGRRIAVRLDLPEGIDAVDAWPVTFGLPLPAGATWDAKPLRLVDRNGREIPAQKEVTGLWAPEGAVKWVRFDALVSSSRGCFVAVAPSRGAAPAKALTVKESDGKVVIDTGAARYVLAKGASPIEAVWLGGKRIAASAGTRGLFVTDQKGRVASASADGETMQTEARGPVAACVRFEGFYRTADREPLARHITRIEASAGQPFAKVTHTLVLCRDTNEVWFQDVGWELAVEPGTGPKATFGVSRDEWQKSLAQPIGEARSAYMLQDEHFRFRQGRNHFVVATLDRDTKPTPLAEGEECGDWAMLSGAAGGLVFACKDAARQHPKEFEVRRNRVVLHLFSHRAGEELDFRTESLIKRWDLRGWYTRALGATPAKVDEYVKKVRAYESNAVGWAKTHELLFAPVEPQAPIARVARLCRLHSQPVHAIADPAWICATQAIAAIHPRDPKRFPRQEKLIDAGVEREIASLSAWGDYGFVDYFAGPHYQTGNPRRYGLTYTLRGDLWLVYARSGSRRLRDFLQACDRSYMDNYFTRWAGAGRIQGMYHSAPGDMWQGYGKGALPFYWEGEPRFDASSSTNLHNFIWQYQLTGYRRAKDVVLEYGDGVKRYWSPARARMAWRSIMAMRLMVQAYGFTWDPELRAMADVTTDQFADDNGELGLTKYRPYQSSTYKTQVDVRALLDAWEITGSPRYHDLAVKVSQYWWDATLGNWPVTYCNPQGRIGSFLYSETGQARYAQGLAVQLRQIAAFYDPETGEMGGYGRSAGTFIYEGIPHAQAVVVAAGADKEPVASWVGYEDFDYPTSIVVDKADDAVVEVDVKGNAPGPGGAGGVAVRPVLLGRASGQTLNRLVQLSAGAAHVRIPKDSAGGAYEIVPTPGGRWFALARSLVPMVLRAPGYWKPQPESAPPVRWWFQVPKDSRDAQILFEGSARLFDPAGQPVGDGELLRGWIDLPADKPGPWSFEPVLNQLVRVRNVPPFFATSAASYFLPKIPWDRDAVPPAVEAPATETVYVPGATERPGDQALYLTGKRGFRLDAGPAHPSGNGGQFVPFEQGTIEFYFKPAWSTFDLPPKIIKRILRMESTGTPYSLAYHKRPNPSSRYRSHCLYGEFHAQGATKRLRTPAYLQAIFERGRWVHVTWVWGMRLMPTHRGRVELLCTQLFVDGKPGKPYVFRRAEPPTDRPTAFGFLPTIDAAVDELRISDVQRYTGAFRPRSRDTEFKPDEHTRALFHFNGSLKGESHGHKGDLPASLEDR